MSTDPVRTVKAVLGWLESAFSDFAAAFHQGQYVLWLGSGISRARVPNVDALLVRVVEHLRANIVEGDADCAYRTALEEVLRLAGLSREEYENVDVSIAVEGWPLRRNCQYLWIGLFQATSVPVDSVGAESADGVMSVGRSSSLPLWKIAPARTRATRCGALTARQRACAASISL